MHILPQGVSSSRQSPNLRGALTPASRRGVWCEDQSWELEDPEKKEGCEPLIFAGDVISSMRHRPLVHSELEGRAYG